MAWVVAFHISFMVVWFSGLFYLPRLFVYHALAEDAVSKERFKVMERRLYVMTNIGLVGTAVLGVWLLIAYAWQAYAGTVWLTTKLVLVAVLIGHHFYCGKLMKDFREERNVRSDKFYRIVNEIPVIPMFVIIIMVVVKPF
jgi:putative membrane protein